MRVRIYKDGKLFRKYRFQKTNNPKHYRLIQLLIKEGYMIKKARCNVQRDTAVIVLKDRKEEARFDVV